MINIPLSRPDITEKEIKYVRQVLKTSYLSMGKALGKFEKSIADYVGAKYAIAVNSGTSALHLIIKALGIQAGDEVITTPFSFISSANCILFEKAKPIFIDIRPDTLNIDPDLIEKKINKKTKAILAVDVFGHSADWNELARIARKYRVKLIEDSCEALGSEYKGRKCGTFGDAGSFAFYPNKQITTGEGGMIVTDNKRTAELCKSMRNQGRSSASNAWLEYTRIGYNYRISDLNCALGIAQMERINKIFAKRAKVVRIYNDRLKEVSEIELPYISKDAKMSWFVYVVRLNKSFSRNQRNKILVNLRKKGIGCNNYFSCIHLQPFYRRMFGYKKGDFPVAESNSERTIALPFYNNLQEGKIEYVVSSLKKAIAKIGKGK